MSKLLAVTEAPDSMFAATGIRVTDGEVREVRLPTEPRSSDPSACFGPLWLRRDGPTVTALVEALRAITAPGYGLQGLLEDGASDAEVAEYWCKKAQRQQAIARAALAALGELAREN